MALYYYKETTVFAHVLENCFAETFCVKNRWSLIHRSKTFVTGMYCSAVWRLRGKYRYCPFLQNTLSFVLGHLSIF